MLAHIVTDEQRSNRPKAARRCAVALGSPLDGVATLARGPTGPRCASLLASGLPKAITACQPGRDWVLA